MHNNIKRSYEYFTTLIRYGENNLVLANLVKCM